MLRTCTYLSPFESVFNRAPEGRSSGHSMPDAALPFEPIAIASIIDAINYFKEPDSMPAVGEKTALMILTKSKDDLVAVVRNNDDEAAEVIVTSLISAQEHFEARLKLIESAMARLIVADEVVKSEKREPPNA